MIPDSGDGRDLGRGQGAQRLDRGAAAVSEDASCVGPWRVDRLCAESGPGVTAADARRALERRGVRVAELPGLAARPPSAIARHPDFADLLARLGRKLSIELVFGSALTRGFRLLKGVRLEDGRRLDQEAIEEAQRQTPAGALHDDWQRVLSILAAAQEPRALDDIAFWEVVEVLRSLARLDYSQRALTEQAVRLSLERGEAEVLAAAVAEEREMLETRDPAAAGDAEPPTAAPDHPAAPDRGSRAGPPSRAGLLSRAGPGCRTGPPSRTGPLSRTGPGYRAGSAHRQPPCLHRTSPAGDGPAGTDDPGQDRHRAAELESATGGRRVLADSPGAAPVAGRDHHRLA